MCGLGDNPLFATDRAGVSLNASPARGIVYLISGRPAASPAAQKVKPMYDRHRSHPAVGSLTRLSLCILAAGLCSWACIASVLAPVGVSALTEMTQDALTVAPRLPRPALVMYGYNDAQRALWSDTLRHFNIVTGLTNDPERVMALRRQGIIFAYHVTNTPAEGRTTAREFADYWAEPLGQTFADRLEGGFDAISIDEFHSYPDGNEESERTIQALRLLRERYPDKLILGWGVWRLADGGPNSLYGDKQVTFDRQLEAIKDCCDLFILENYCREANPQLDLIPRFARNLEERCPGLLRKTIYGLYIAQSEPFIADDSVDYDYKGFLDEQLSRIRKDPVTRSMPGVGFWAFYRAHMDTTIWAGQLVDHYYRGGSNASLHPHGPGQIVRDGSFEAPGGEGDAWELVAGAKDTCARRPYSDLKDVAPSHGAVKHGSSALVMQRQVGVENKARQVLELRPGEWYAATVYVQGPAGADLDVLGPRSDDRTDTYRVENNAWQGWARLSRAFLTPRSGKVTLVLTDSSAPEGTQLVWDFAEVEWLPPGCRPLQAAGAIWEGMHVICRGENLAPGCRGAIGTYELEPAEWHGFGEATWRVRVGMTFGEAELRITWPQHSLIPYNDSCRVVLRY